MFLLSSHLFGIACQARDRAVAAVQANPQATPADTTVAIIMSTAANEGFINEAAALVGELASAGTPFKVTPQQAAFAKELLKLERKSATLKDKYLAASKLLSGKEFVQTSPLFQDFVLLVKLRNDHMHLKPKDAFRVEGENVVVEPPPYIETFQRRHLARKCGKDEQVSWLNLVQTAEMATWAVKTALDIILAVLKMTPNGRTSWDDPFSRFKREFRQQRDKTV